MLVQSSSLSLNVMVKNRIAELINERNERNQMDVDFVLLRLAAIDQMNVINILNDSSNLSRISGTLRYPDYISWQ